MAVEDLGPAERLAAGAIGQPGQRRFFLEVTAGGRIHSFPCEKAQVAELAQQGLQLLTLAGLESDEEAVQRLVGSRLPIIDPVMLPSMTVPKSQPNPRSLSPSTDTNTNELPARNANRPLKPNAATST